MKKITFLSVFTLLFQFTFFAQNSNSIIDAAGDIIIVAYDSTGNDGLAFVLLDDAPAGTAIRFTDEEWLGSAFNNLTFEGDLLWENNTGSTISAGVLIKITNANGTGISVNLGDIEESDSGFTLASGDQVIAYTGTRATPGTFLTAHGDENSVNAGETHTLSGTGLTNGVNAYTLADGVGRYTGTTNFAGESIANVSAALTNPSNWTLGAFTFSTGVIGDLTLATLSSEGLTVSNANVYSSNNSFESNDATLTIEIYNSLGQKVNNENLISGIYILKVSNPKGEVVTLKRAI